MKAAFLSFIVYLASVSRLASAVVNLNSFPDVVHEGSTYTLSWTATANYTYTIWLVQANDYESGEYDWTKVEGLALDLYYQDLAPSYKWTVPVNTSTAGFYALWLDAFPIPFDGASLFNITDWFSISSTPSSPTSTSSSAMLTPTSTATHTSEASTQTPSSSHHSSISGGAIAGIVVGILAALALIVGALLLARKRKRMVGIKEREAQARANRLAPVMQSPAAIEMHGRNAELAKETNV